MKIATADEGESNALRTLPDDACRIVLDREASTPGNWSIVYLSAVVDPLDIGPIKFEPVLAGSHY